MSQSDFLFDNKTILVVEDHKVVFSGLKFLLTNWHKGVLEILESDSAHNTKELISRRCDIDLIILDLKLPDTQGYELLDYLIKRMPNTAVLIVTAESDMSVIYNVYQRGAKGFVSKSSDVDEYIKALDALFSGSVYFPNIDLRSIPLESLSDSHAFSRSDKLSLTRRQLQILEKLSQGKTNKEIAQLLHMSPATVRSYLTIIFRQLNTKNRTEAVHIARNIGLIGE